MRGVRQGLNRSCSAASYRVGPGDGMLWLRCLWRRSTVDLKLASPRASDYQQSIFSVLDETRGVFILPRLSPHVRALGL